MYENNFPLLPVFGGTTIEGNNGLSEKFVGMHGCVTFQQIILKDPLLLGVLNSLCSIL